MILALLLTQAAVVAEQPARPPQDWTAMPALRYVAPPRFDPRLSLFVRGEVAAGRCDSAVRDEAGWTLKVDFAVLVDAQGHARDAVPRAISCPTVEQYAAGALSRIVRDNIYPTGLAEDAWRKTSLVFTWTG